MAMIEKEIRVQTTDGEMTTFAVHPDGEGPFPVAVVFMDGVGYREQVKANARRFAGDGYHLVDQFREELRRNRGRGVVERMPGVAHGFAMADLPVYNRDAAERHFERTLDLWRRKRSMGPITQP